MNKKILLSLLIIGIIASVASAGTWAYFSDVKSTTEGTIQAGTLLLNGGTISQKTIFGDSYGKDTIYPGASIEDTLWVGNGGTIAGDLYVRISPDSSNKALLDDITLTVNTQPLTESYTKISDYMEAYDGMDVDFACSMPVTEDDCQGNTLKFKVDFLLVQDGVTDLNQLTPVQLTP